MTAACSTITWLEGACIPDYIPSADQVSPRGLQLAKTGMAPTTKPRCATRSAQSVPEPAGLRPPNLHLPHDNRAVRKELSLGRQGTHLPFNAPPLPLSRSAGLCNFYACSERTQPSIQSESDHAELVVAGQSPRCVKRQTGYLRR